MLFEEEAPPPPSLSGYMTRAGLWAHAKVSAALLLAYLHPFQACLCMPDT